MSQPKLFCVEIKVDVKPQHPRFFEIQFGVLYVWLFDETPDTVINRATDFVALLPYEVIGEPKLVCSDRNAVNESADCHWMANGEDEAKNIGVGFYLAAAETGKDRSWLD